MFFFLPYAHHQYRSVFSSYHIHTDTRDVGTGWVSIIDLDTMPIYPTGSELALVWLTYFGLRLGEMKNTNKKKRKRNVYCFQEPPKRRENKSTTQLPLKTTQHVIAILLAY